jgi:Na+-driven multidrug efflux pump
MRSRTSIAKWNLFFHYSSTVIGIINGIAIVPLYLKFIDHALFGAWLATGNVLVWLTIVEPGVGDVLQQRVSAAIGGNENENAGKFILSGILISLFISLLVLIGGSFVSIFIPDILNLSNSIDTKMLLDAFLITVIGTSFSMLSYAFVGSNQGLQSSLGIGIIYLISSIIGIIFNIYLLFNGYGLLSIAFATLIRSGVLCLGNIIYLFYRIKRQNIHLSFSKVFFIDFSKLFSYTFFSKISTTVVGNVDLILVARFVSPEMVTMLELTRRPIKILQGFTDRVSVAFMSPLSNLKGEGNYIRIKEIFIRFIKVYVVASSFIIFGFVALNEHLLKVWAGDNVFIGNPLNILLCITLFISSLLYNFSIFTYALGDIKGNSTIGIIKSVFYIFFIVILGYLWGIYGIVLASLLSSMLTEAWYYPNKLNTFLKFDKIEIKGFLKEISILVTVSIIISSIIVFYHPKITNWGELVVWSVIFSFVFAILFIPFSKNTQNELLGVYKMILKKK